MKTRRDLVLLTPLQGSRFRTPALTQARITLLNPASIFPSAPSSPQRIARPTASAAASADARVRLHRATTSKQSACSRKEGRWAWRDLGVGIISPHLWAKKKVSWMQFTSHSNSNSVPGFPSGLQMAWILEHPSHWCLPFVHGEAHSSPGRPVGPPGSAFRAKAPAPTKATRKGRLQGAKWSDSICLSGFIGLDISEFWSIGCLNLQAGRNTPAKLLHTPMRCYLTEPPPKDTL